MLIGGAIAFAGGVIVLLAGLADEAQTLLAVAVGIMAVGAAATLWDARREAAADAPADADSQGRQAGSSNQPE